MKQINNFLRIFLFFVFGIYFIISIYYGQHYTLFVSICAYAIILSLMLLERIWFKAPEIYIFIIYFLIFTGMLLGDVVNVYATNFIYDKVLHIMTGVILFVLGLGTIYARHPDHYVFNNIFKAFVYAFFFMLLIESVWESIETTLDLNFGTNTTQGGIVDTTWDYIMDLVGGMLAMIFCYIHIKKWPIPLLDLFLKSIRDESKYTSLR